MTEPVESIFPHNNNPVNSAVSNTEETSDMTITTMTGPQNSSSTNPSSSSASDTMEFVSLGISTVPKDLWNFEMVEVGVTDTDPNANEMPTKKESQEVRKWGRYIGLLLAILSSLMFSINALIFKMLNHNPPLTPAILMFFGTAALTLPLYLHQRFIVNPLISDVGWKTAGILLLRGFTGCSGMLLFFCSLQYLSIGDALVIACSSPVFVFLLAFFFLKENCGVVPIITIVFALIGVVIITRPPLLTGEESFKQNDLIGVGLAFLSMLSIASTLVLMRYLQNIHHSLINLIFGIWGTFQTLGLALILGELNSPKNIPEAAIMLGTGLIFFGGQTFLTLALQLEDAGPVSLVRTSEVVFAFMWQFLFLNVYPDAFSFTGAVLIMVGILTTLLRKWIGSLPVTYIGRKRLGFLLK